MMTTNILVKLSLFLSNEKNINSKEVFQIFILTVAVSTTATLMWSYTFNSFFTLENLYHINILCFIYSLVHLLSPFLYKIYPSVPLVMNTFIGAGFLFQFHHAFLTGGFYSNTIIWFSILPLLAGVIAGVKYLALWSLISIGGVLLQFILTQNGIYHDVISNAGRIWAQFNITIGYIGINLGLMFAYINYREAAEKALESKQYRIKNLLRIVVHDISNPLTLILFSNSKLKREIERYKDTELKLATDRIEKGSETIKAIIESTRQLESLNQEEQSYELEMIDIKEAIDRAIIILMPKLCTKNIEIKVDVPDKTFAMAKMSTFTSQVLINILSNAIKFSFENNEIKIWHKEDEQSVSIFLQDYGLGMSDHQINNLFDDKMNKSKMGTNGEEGSGYGMPIVAKTVEMLDGKITVSSSQKEPNRGTTFKITLRKK